jgi:hypothetical protein
MPFIRFRVEENCDEIDRGAAIDRVAPKGKLQ